MRAAALLTLAALALPGAASALDPLTGEARAVGPTTIVVQGSRVHLAGLDPSLPAPACAGRPDACAEGAQAALAALVAGQPVACRPERRLGHGSVLGACDLPDARDLGESLIAAGWAVPDAAAPAAYRDALAAAKGARLGLWAEGGDG
jgi:endonuclease YncB( thermonuclease family)